MRRLFIALDRPHLEYCTVAWRPHSKIDRYKIESVLKRATKLVPELRHLPYEERLVKMKIPSMWYRHQRADVIEVWKYQNGLYNASRPTLTTVKESYGERPRTNTRAANSGALEKRRAPNNSSTRLNFFSFRAVNLWNSLPPDAMAAKTMNSFKNSVDRHWRDKIYRTPFGPFAEWPIIE